MRRLGIPISGLVLALVISPEATAWGQLDPELGSEFGKRVNSLTYPAAFGVAVGHLLSSSPTRVETGRRVADAMVITGALTSALKRVVISPRPAPYQTDRHGFPSGHASLAFAVAAALGEREPSSRWIAYPLAAAAGWARHDLQRHTWAQVVGGALLGTWVGRQAGRGKVRLSGHPDPGPAGTGGYDLLWPGAAPEAANFEAGSIVLYSSQF